MAYWSLEIDPRSAFDPTAMPCTIITYRRKIGNHAALIECSVAAATQIAQQPGVTALIAAADGHYIDDSGATYEVSGGGTRCTYLGRP